MGEPERSKFDAVAAQYAAARPNYPAALFDAVGAALPRPWPQTTVLDVAAGTGIATRQLAERAGRVVAVELSPTMLGELRAADPAQQAAQGNGHALPIRDAAVDLVTYAQAFHWMDPDRALPEVQRVLRPDGLLALWWNKAVRPGDWETAQAERLTAVAPGWQNGGRISSAEAIAMLGKFGLSLTEQQFAWEREISVENHLVNLVSKSYVAELADRDGFIASERRILLDAFPSGRLTERFTTRLLLITR